MNIGRAVKEIRKEKDIRQKEITAVVGVSSNVLSHIEHGDWIPRWDSLEKIAKALNTTTGEIIFRALDAEDLTKEQIKNYIIFLTNKL
jgi:transcriptional regulator with XRE-family HTH domain